MNGLCILAVGSTEKTGTSVDYTGLSENQWCGNYSLVEPFPRVGSGSWMGSSKALLRTGSCLSYCLPTPQGATYPLLIPAL